MANGEVMNRVRSFLLEPTFANREGMAPEDVARRRAMAEALWSQGNSSQPVVGVFDGMNRVLQSFLGGRQMRKAEDADQFIRQREDQQQQAGLQQMAAFAYPNQTTTEPPTTRPLATPTYGAGTQNEWSAGDWPGGAQTTAPGTGIDAGVRLLDQYEGFSGTPYDDWSYRPGSGERYNSGQRIGYGQTIPGQTSITQEQAQQLLRQQIETEYVPSIVNTIGPERWSSFTPDQQGVLISLVHNYGSLPNRILDEIATGDPQAIAGAITALGEDNQGINRNRRTGEAAYFAGTPGERTTTAANPVGEFVQGLISNPQTRGVAAQLIGDQITRLTTPPAPQEPYTLGANETRFDANNRPVAQGQGTSGGYQENVIPPAEYQTRGLTQLPPGYVWIDTETGPQARGAAAPVAPYEARYDAVVGEQDAKLRGDINDAETNAFAQLNTYDAMEQLLNDPNFYSGVMADQVAGLRRFFGAIGLADPQSALAIENFGALANESVLKALGGSLGAQISNSDRSFLQQTVPNLSFSEEGNRTLLAIQRAVAQRQIDVAQMARDYSAARGGIDDGFRQQIAQWREANPLFPQGSIPGISAAPSPMRTGTPQPATFDQRFNPTATGTAPPGGTVYQGGIVIQRLP